MTRKYQNFMSGTLSVGISSTDTSITSTGLAALTTVANPDVIYLVLDPAGVNGAPEILFVAAHSASSTSATVIRGQEGTTARSHNSGVAWVAGVTAADMTRFDVIEAAGWVTTTRLVDAAVTSAKLANNSVIAGKIAAGSITPSNVFAAGVVDSTALANDAVTTAKIVDGAVTAAKLNAATTLAFGRVASTQIVATAGAAGASQTDVAGLSVTFTMVAGRKYRAGFSGNTTGTDVDITHQLFVVQIGQTQVGWSAGNIGQGPYMPHHPTLELTTVAGSCTVKVAIARTGGASNINVFASVANPAQLWVDDVGVV